MARYTERLSEQLAVVATIDPQSISSSANTDVIDMQRFNRVLFILLTGTISSTGTVDFDVYKGATNSPSTKMTGKSITQLTQAGSGSDSQVVIEVTAEELGPGYRYIKGTWTRGTANALGAVVVLGDCDRYGPASDHDLSSVAEIVA